MNKMLMQTTKIDEHFETMHTKQMNTSEGHVWLVGGVGVVVNAGGKWGGGGGGGH